MAFTKKLLTATVTPTGGSAVKLSGLRMSFDASSAPNQAKTLDSLVVYGMTESQMNQLSNAGQNWNQVNPSINGKITVEAGDENGMSNVYNGGLHLAVVDATQPPHVKMIFTGWESVEQARKAAAPTTQQGAVPATSLFGTLAQVGGYQYADHGVQAVIRNPYLPGTVINQIRLLAEMANCNWHIADGVLHAWPPSASIPSSTVLSKRTGLVASPLFMPDRVAYIKTAFQPQIGVLTEITLQTRWTAANGKWTINHVLWQLDSGVPRGRWFLELTSLAMPKGALGP